MVAMKDTRKESRSHTIIERKVLSIRMSNITTVNPRITALSLVSYQKITKRTGSENVLNVNY